MATKQEMTRIRQSLGALAGEGGPRGRGALRALRILSGDPINVGRAPQRAPSVAELSTRIARLERGTRAETWVDVPGETAATLKRKVAANNEEIERLYARIKELESNPRLEGMRAGINQNVGDHPLELQQTIEWQEQTIARLKERIAYLEHQPTKREQQYGPFARTRADTELSEAELAEKMGILSRPARMTFDGVTQVFGAHTREEGQALAQARANTEGRR